MDEDYKSRVDGNIRFIQTLRADVDEQRALYNERRKQNAELNSELDRQRNIIADRNAEVQQLNHEFGIQSDRN
jgi:hypothetical protein